MKKIQLLLALVLSATMASCYHNERTANSNIVYENIMTRTSIRHYTNQSVGRDTIETLLHAGMAAPTGVNQQPWKFVVLTNRTMLNSIATMPGKGMAKEAPLAIVVCGDKQNMIEGLLHDLWIQDCSAATENILLMAHAMGLGAVWTWIYPTEDMANNLRAMTEISESLEPLSIIMIGHPAEDPMPKDKWNEEKIIWME